MYSWQYRTLMCNNLCVDFRLFCVRPWLIRRQWCAITATKMCTLRSFQRTVCANKWMDWGKTHSIIGKWQQTPNDVRCLFSRNSANFDAKQRKTNWSNNCTHSSCQFSSQFQRLIIVYFPTFSLCLFSVSCLDIEFQTLILIAITKWK